VNGSQPMNLPRGSFFYGIIPGVLLFFATTDGHSQAFSDQTYLIADLSETALTERVIQREAGTGQVGICIQLSYDRDKERLIAFPENGGIPFEVLSEIILTNLENNREKILPLFINYAGPVSILNDAVVTSGLSERMYYLPPGERWPQVAQILETNRNLVCFIFQNPNPGNIHFHYAWDYMAEYPHSGMEDPPFDGHYINGDITKELLLIRDFFIPEPAASRDRSIWDLNQNQFYINHLLNRWKNTGKQPNFIFTTRSTRFLSPLIPWLSTYKSVKGIVRINEKPMEKVFWKHSNKCITNGYFSFPYSEGEELNLTPFSPGYRFDPQMSVVSTENLLLSVIFNASPLSLDEGLTACFPFDNGWQNEVDKQDTGIPVQASITSDVNKGEVAKLTDSSFIQIGYPQKYGIRNNSFTVSAWFKLNVLDMNSEYSILGTHEGVFRKGLHLVIRQGRPYFGFYGNDLWADRVVSPNEWFHIVYRYNYFNGEQAIYVNGQNVGASLNHASFIGDSTLVIGQSIRSDNFLNGYIDDLFIWSRPLGEEEIQILYNSDYKPEMEQTPGFPHRRMILAGIVIFIVLFTGLIAGTRKRKSREMPAAGTEKEPVPQLKNSLFIFGDFQLFDALGNELSTQFTPKIKELFLLILLYTVKNKRGIRTEQLTAVLWPGFPPSKAANNRSVTINKLRKLIRNVKGLNVSYQNGYWTLEMGKDLYCDYLQVITMLQKQDLVTKEKMELFFNRVKRGGFLDDLDWEWLDEFRGSMVNDIIDNLILYASRLDEKTDCRLLTEIAERILIIDELNEKAIQIIIKQLLLNNNINKARYRFVQFTRAFEKAVGVPYTMSFDQFRNMAF
jgi:DNA-binding SARP family transcriptional activator